MKRKVLLIGPAYFNYNRSIASAFDPDKFELRIIDYTEEFGQITFSNKIAYFFSRKRNTTTQKLLEKLNEYIIATYNHFRPDIVLVIKGDVICEKTVLEMNKSKNILWMLDGISSKPLSLKMAEKMDAVFLFEKTEVEEVKKINANTFYLPPAFDDQIFKKLQLKKDIDLLFIGILYDSRIKLLEKIHVKFPQLKMKVYCKRYWFYKTPFKYLKSLKDNVFINRFVTPAEANVLYNRTNICLNMHHKQSIYGINPRFFEILGSNSLQFVDRKPFIEEYFPDYNIYTYTTEEDLFDMIGQKFYNDIPWDDQTFYSTINKHHTYRNRVDYILERI